ncbi:MAG: hypothetical protein NVSMB60_28030 [Mycobacterium sp.]
MRIMRSVRLIGLQSSGAKTLGGDVGAAYQSHGGDGVVAHATVEQTGRGIFQVIGKPRCEPAHHVLLGLGGFLALARDATKRLRRVSRNISTPPPPVGGSEEPGKGS